jgi:hypothetical protein
MRAGRVVCWEKLEFRIEVEAGLERSSEYPGAKMVGELLTRFSDSQETLSDGVRLKIESSVGGSGSSFSDRLGVNFEIPYLGLRSEVELDHWKSFVVSRAVFNNVCLYRSNKGQWLLRSSSVDWFIDDQLKQSFEAITVEGYLLTPSSVPLLGVPACLRSSCEVEPGPVMGFGKDGLESFTARAHCEARGGWRFFERSEWHALPMDMLGQDGVQASDTYSGLVCSSAVVEYAEIDQPDIVCELGSDGQPAIQSAVMSCKKVIKKLDSKQGSAVLLPSLKKRVGRMNEDYAALIYRGSMPAVYRVQQSGHLDYAWSANQSLYDVPHVPVVDKTVVCPGADELFDVALSRPGKIEEPFGLKSYAPYSVKHHGWEVVDYDVQEKENGIYKLSDGQIHREVPDYTMRTKRTIRQYSSSDEFPVLDQGEQSGLPSLGHADGLVRYLNTSVHPHWSAYYVFHDWSVDKIPVKASEYWLPLKTQFLEHLDAGIKRRTRTSLVSAALSEVQDLGRFSGGWWGIQRFKALPFEPAEFCVAGCKGWSLDGGQLNHDGGLIVHADRKHVVLTLDLDAACDDLGYFASLGGKVGLGWSGAGC